MEPETQSEQPILRLDIFKAGRIVQYDRDEPGRGHAWARTECLTLEEGVRRMGYVEQTPRFLFPCGSFLHRLTVAIMVLRRIPIAWKEVGR